MLPDDFARIEVADDADVGLDQGCPKFQKQQRNKDVETTRMQCCYSLKFGNMDNPVDDYVSLYFLGSFNMYSYVG